MFGKSSEAKYLDVLLDSMEQSRLSLVRQCPPNRAKATDWIAACLADVISKFYVASIVCEYASSRAASGRLKRASRILESAKMNAFSLVEALGLDMAKVTAIGRRETHDFVQHIGGDAILQWEYGLEGYAAYRRKAVRAVLPDAEEIALNAHFEEIIKAVW